MFEHTVNHVANQPTNGQANRLVNDQLFQERERIAPLVRALFNADAPLVEVKSLLSSGCQNSSGTIFFSMFDFGKSPE